MALSNKQDIPTTREFSPGRFVWHLFSSIKLAFILMLILIALSIIGILLIQIPADYTGSPADVSWWMENVAQPGFGPWYPILAALGLFDIFHSFLFLGAGVLLIFSIIVCSVNRLKQVRALVSTISIKQQASFYKGGDNQQEIEAPATPETGLVLAQVLKRYHYKMRKADSAGDIFFAADKNRFTYLGTYLIHFSLILFIAGFLVGSFTGFRLSSFAVAEGATREVGYGTNLSLRLESFTDEYWPDGTPKDYRSQVAVYEAGKEVKQAVVQVNHPLSYNGVRFYQAYFGPAVNIQVRSGDKILFKGGIALSGSLENHPYQRPSGGLRLPGGGYSIFLVGSALNLPDSVISADQVAMEVYKTGSTSPVAQAILEQGTPYTVEGLEITFLEKAQFSGFQVSRDPGNNLIWLASGLFLVGLGLVFYFPRRQLWAWIKSDSGGKSTLRLHSDSGKGPGATAEFNNMLADLERRLNPDRKTDKEK